jgi:hypothetical protein
LKVQLILTSNFVHFQKWLMVQEEQEDETVVGLVKWLLPQNRSVVLEMLSHQLGQFANLWAKRVTQIKLP